MKKLIAISVFSIGLRVFAAPSMCDHSHTPGAPEREPEKHAGCHEHTQTHVQKQPVQPCNHMKDCLLDAGHEETLLPVSDYGFHHTSVVQNFIPAAIVPDQLQYRFEKRFQYDPFPPQFLTVHQSLFIIKSSLLI